MAWIKRTCRHLWGTFVPVPPSPVLKAALRWLELLPRHELSRARALFRSLPEFNDISPTQYEAAYDWLQERKFLDSLPHSTDLRTTIFTAAIADTLWFSDVDVLITQPEDLPSDGLRAAEAVGLSNEDAFAAVWHSWRKVDAAQRAHIGRAGEKAIVNLLSASGIPADHVSQHSDGYGYDVSATLPDRTFHLEIKATNKRGQLRFYLSRNEFETMRRDPDWILVAVRLNTELEPVSVATVCRQWISETVPADRKANGRWESVRLDVAASAICPGISRLSSPPATSVHGMLRGEPPWPG